MDKASEAVLALKPVSFRYKKEIDASGTLQFGLVAEEVADINADLVTRDSEGKPETVRYEAVNAMLLNEFLKEHNAFVQERRKVQEQGATIARLERQIEALAAGLQKVSAQLELSKAGPQTVLKNQ
jgi:polyhydroxyalkanoate synthesis regulator phasin